MKKIYKLVLGLTIICIISYFAMNDFNRHTSDEVIVKEITEVEQRYVNLVAFAKLFGYVRYFHPSDEASELENRI